MPLRFCLYPNYPNPFNSSTRIEFDLPEKVLVTLGVYDVLGREVAVLVDGELEGRRHRVDFHANDLPGCVLCCS